MHAQHTNSFCEVETTCSYDLVQKCKESLLVLGIQFACWMLLNVKLIEPFFIRPFSAFKVGRFASLLSGAATGHHAYNHAGMETWPRPCTGTAQRQACHARFAGQSCSKDGILMVGMYSNKKRTCCTQNHSVKRKTSRLQCQQLRLCPRFVSFLQVLET